MSGELAGISGWELATVIDAVMGLPIVSEIWPSGERPSTHELLDELAVLGNVFFHQVFQQSLALAYQCHQRAAAGVVLTVLLQMLGKHLNAVGKESNLALCGAGILFRAGMLAEDVRLFFTR